MKKQNLHTHTAFVDGKDTPEAIIREAIDKGFDSIGFSEHSYLEYSSYPYQLTPEKMIIYKDEIHRLKKKYADIIDIFCGLEYDFYSNVDTNNFDYLIGSVHYLDCGNGILKTFDLSYNETIEYINDYFHGDPLEFAKQYYETVIRLPEKKSFDIIGHFDLVTKNNAVNRFLDTSSKKYLDMGFNTIHELKNKIPFFEVNTGAISRGYTDKPYPQIEFLNEFKKCGFGAVISSDCHNKAFLDCCFSEARDLLLEAGFKSIWILTNNGFKEVGL
jgi:histidinol-phosphatase (PHP family)